MPAKQLEDLATKPKNTSHLAPGTRRRGVWVACGLGLILACAEPAPPAKTDTHAELPVAPLIELEVGRRRLTAAEERRFVATAAALRCVHSLSAVGGSNTSPEGLDYAGTVIDGSGFSVADLVAIERGTAVYEPVVSGIRARASAICGSPAEISLREVSAAVAIRRRSVADGPELSGAASLYAAAAVDLLCFALSGEPVDVDLGRSEILADHGFDELSFEAAAERARDEPRVLAAIATGVRRCPTRP